MIIIENDFEKALRSRRYNFFFNKRNGFFARWGSKPSEDPYFSPFGPELLDIEISSGGDCKGKCPYCYKQNSGNQPTHNMTVEEFKIIFDKMPKTLTQIAYGIMNISTNPDFFRMMEYAKEHGVIPNYTCHGLDVTDEYAAKTAELGGAVAVSVVDKQKTYSAVKKFLNAGVEQVTIHFVLSEESYGNAFEIIDDAKEDPRLKGLKAIIFLQYKPKGRNAGKFSSVLDADKYAFLIEYAMYEQVGIGFDSCSGPIVLDGFQENKNKKYFETLIEPCESGLFSSYINCHGEFFVCSFAEGENEWQEGIDVLHCNDFLTDVWFNDRLITWRQNLLSKKRNCPIYNLNSVRDIDVRSLV